MGMFDAINTAGTGLETYKTWLDAISDNIANINTVKPTSQAAFQQRFVVSQAIEGGTDGTGQGVKVASIAYGSAVGQLRSDPTNPLADAQGLVRAPDMDLGDQMSQMIIAQRSYQANASLVTRAQAAYQAALNIGKA
jgi:flagellar basal-body rod protein FlgC